MNYSAIYSCRLPQSITLFTQLFPLTRICISKFLHSITLGYFHHISQAVTARRLDETLKEGGLLAASPKTITSIIFRERVVLLNKFISTEMWFPSLSAGTLITNAIGGSSSFATNALYNHTTSLKSPGASLDGGLFLIQTIFTSMQLLYNSLGLLKMMTWMIVEGSSNWTSHHWKP